MSSCQSPRNLGQLVAQLLLTVGLFGIGCSSSSTAPGATDTPVEGGTSPAAGGGNGTGGSAGSSSAAGGAQTNGGSIGTGGAFAASGGTSAASGGAVSGGGGGSNGGQIGQGGQGQGGACMALASPCDVASPNCCTGLICVASTSADYAGCRQPCNIAADCASGCCIPFANYPDRGFCGDASLCQCSALNQPCGGTHVCCSGFTCTTYDATNVLGCRPKCTKDADCDTTCCVAIPGTSDSACFTPNYCGR